MNSSVLEKPQTAEEAERSLRLQMGAMRHDPYKFVKFSFPWGKGSLENCQIEDWQSNLLKRVRDGLVTYQQAIQEAISSGHGVGKSALVSWLILWAMSTFPETRGVVTANTSTQLLTKTWPELAKWHNLFIAKHWFTVNATSIVSSEAKYEKTWRIDAIPWSRNKEMQTEAFAGLHNQGKRVLLIFDEASAVHDKIYEVSEGAMTDANTEIIWVIFGNPTRNVGRFHAAFHKLKHRWHTTQVDSRNVRISNKKQISKWVEDYGENSDFVKVRVRGEFPSVGDKQFISTALVDAARGKHIPIDQYNFAPVIIGVDPAWTGGDETVIYKRQGLASTMLMKLAKNDDDTLVAGFVAGFEDEHKADAVFIDMGYGTGIYSAGKQMNRRWNLVSFAGASNDAGYLNKRAEMWKLMKDWLREGGALPDDPQICEELPGPESHPNLKGQTVIESKEDMKERGLTSPNRADALALTFAMPVRKKLQHDPVRKQESSEPMEYKVYG